jgi:hypothetical protein
VLLPFQHGEEGMPLRAMLLPSRYDVEGHTPPHRIVFAISTRRGGYAPPRCVICNEEEHTSSSSYYLCHFDGGVCPSASPTTLEIEHAHLISIVVGCSLLPHPHNHRNRACALDFDG